MMNLLEIDSKRSWESKTRYVYIINMRITWNGAIADMRMVNIPSTGKSD